MKDNKEFINGIYSKYEEYLKDSTEKYTYKNNAKNILKNNTRSTIIRNTLKLASTTIIIALISTLLIDKNESMRLNNKEEYIYKPESTYISTVDTFDNFYNIIKNSTNISNLNSRKENAIMEDEVVFNNSEKLDSVETKKEDTYSKTNNQVSDVEEADIVKTDGRYIYYITDNELVIIDTENPSNLKQLYKTDYTETEFRPQELYIYEDKIIIIGNTNIYSRDNVKTYTASLEDYAKPIYNKTKAIIYDMKNKENLIKIREVDLTGYIISSRMIGEYLYIVSNQYINTGSMVKCPVEELVEDDYKPSYLDTAFNEKENKVEFKDIKYFDNIDSANFLMIAGLNVNNSEKVNIKTFLGSGEEIYVSQNNMYIAKHETNYNDVTNEVIDSNTEIVKFELDNSNIEYKAETKVSGYINNQFSMDENNGTFRIATTEGIMWNVTDNTTNSLYILDENLKEVGKIVGLAKGEKIYSVRYTKNRAYIVTYEEVDPLFVINLEDSKNPTLLGELKIEGYSTYLHEYDENHLIGFGYDTKYDGKNTIMNGLKMVMFDITDLSNPKELFSVKIGDKYTSSTLTYNHKALLYSKERNIIGFPINAYRSKNQYKAQIYNIDLEKGFTLKGEIVQKGDNYKNNIERIIYIGNNFYAISRDMIKSISMETFEELDTIKF